jgi:chitin disaccharide deacetylase
LDAGPDPRPESTQVQLVVNADDLGMSPEITRGILRAHREGVVTSASLLATCPDLDEVRRLLAAAPELGIGAHLNLLDGRPVADPAMVSSLLAPDGRFWSRGQDFITAWAKGKIIEAEVERELDAQVTRLRNAGIEVDHLDTHHHLGFLPAVGRAVETVAKRHGIGGIRSVVERPTLAWLTEPARGLQAGLLTGMAWLTRKQLGARRHGPQSWGYVESGRLDEIRVLEIIGRLGPGPHELICHPGEEDVAPGEGPSVRYHRTGELTALTSTKVRRAIERRGITLCRWRDLI